MTALYIALIVLACIYSIVIWVVTASLSIRLQEKKGHYDGSLLLSLVLGFFYFIYSIALPTRDAQPPLEENAQQNNQKEDVVFCPKCGNQIFDDQTRCSMCGWSWND